MTFCQISSTIYDGQASFFLYFLLLVYNFREELLPRADLLTPNVKEASALLGGKALKTVADMRTAAKLLHEMGPRFVNENHLR